MWYVEAGKYNVLPVDSRGRSHRRSTAADRLASHQLQVLPRHTDGARQRWTELLNRPYSITADVEIPKGGAEGALLSAGDVQGGFSFYVQGGKLHYVYNYVGSHFFHVESTCRRSRGAP